MTRIIISGDAIVLAEPSAAAVRLAVDGFHVLFGAHPVVRITGIFGREAMRDPDGAPHEWDILNGGNPRPVVSIGERYLAVALGDIGPLDRRAVYLDPRMGRRVTVRLTLP